MHAHILTIFPELFPGPLSAGIAGRALQGNFLKLGIRDIRDHTHDRRKTTDDAPYGGDPGMVMRPEPLFEAVESLDRPPNSPIILLTPQGKLFTQGDAERYSQQACITIICGRYEGIDERVSQGLGAEEVSIGDYVLSGGEIAAMVIVESIARLLPGVIGHGPDAIQDDSHTSGVLQHPQYTRPTEYRGLKVPEILLSGNHAAIEKWRRQQSLKKTLERRPDLLQTASLTEGDLKILKEYGWSE